MFSTTRRYGRLLGFSGVETIDLAHGAVVLRVGWNDIDAVGVVLDTVEDRLCQWAVVAAKLVIPTAVVVLGGICSAGSLLPDDLRTPC